MQIIAPGNKLAGTFVANGQVAAGASADVSWFPFVGAAGSGIQFDTDNQGGWLDVTANDTDAALNGIRFRDNSGSRSLYANTPAGIDLLGQGTDLFIGQHGGLVLETGGEYRIYDDTGLIVWFEVTDAGAVKVGEGGGTTHIRGSDIQALSAGGISATAAGGVIFLNTTTGVTSAMIQARVTAGNYFLVNDTDTAAEWFRAGSGLVRAALPVGGKFEVIDHSGNPIFRVNENGDLQGKTGKALTFNL